MGPLHGIRIIDLTSVVMGPFATQILAEMGAEVIKVEAPEGDITRQIGPARARGSGALYLNANRHKRSICLDLKRPEALDLLDRLLKSADVLATNIRPAAMARLGLDATALLVRHPRLVYAAMVGFGQTGPYAGKPAYDDLIQGAAGLSALMSEAGDGTPRYAPVALADRVAGLAAVGAICAALFERERTGSGCEVEIPMFETMASVVLGDHLAGQTFEPSTPERSYARLMSPHRRPFATRDGHICAVVYTDRQWTAFLDQTEMSDLPRRDLRFATFAARNAAIDDVYAFLAELFATRSTAEWLDLLGAADIPAMPMHTMESLVDDPHLTATEFIRIREHPVQGSIRTLAPATRWPGRTPAADRPAPELGADGAALLKEAGFDDGEIEVLRMCGALLLPDEDTHVAI
ncbi:MAG: CoA transferase [Sphingomonadales bacterium]|nr:MAG: CoA transferase [Sphingomonadales bacterium]